MMGYLTQWIADAASFPSFLLPSLLPSIICGTSCATDKHLNQVRQAGHPLSVSETPACVRLGFGQPR